MKNNISKQEKIEEILTRGVEQVFDLEHLKKALAGEKLNIKHGVDPTGPKIHLGRASALLKLKDLQDLGHQIILIIGDFTAQIGDASDKTAMRKDLSEEEIKKNMADYLPQIGRVLDMEKTKVYYNGEWLSRLAIKNLFLIAQNFTAQQMIQRRNFKERWDQDKPIGLHELLYPLFQGYDSVAIRADLEVGGYDQLFNIQTGREVQKFFGQKQQDIMSLKMLIGPDGRKMSTSWGNVINIIDAPQQIYGMIMSMRDELMFDYFEICTRVPMSRVAELKKEMKEEKINPRDIKKELAREIVNIFHGPEAAALAEQEFENVFKDKKLPSEITQIGISGKEDIGISDLLVALGLAPSKAEAKRLIGQKGVKMGEGENLIVKEDWQEKIKIEDGMIIQVGKRKFAKIKKV
ncbi:MAG: tyrosine--tRNA ligase [Candidatus Paceibacterota bacterium]|jgi:tyrosyl-tRNA synthetase